MSETAPFSSWPIPGSNPVLSFYYNINWRNVIAFQEGTYDLEYLLSIQRSEIPIVEKPTDPSSNPIGYLSRNVFQGPKTVDELFAIILNSGDSICFQANTIRSSPPLTDGQTISYRITSGSGAYLFDQGYVLITYYNNGDRFANVYSGILKDL